MSKEVGVGTTGRLEHKYCYEAARQGVSRRSTYCTIASKPTASRIIVTRVAKSAGVLNEAPKVISITPVNLDLTHAPMLEELRKWNVEGFSRS